MSLTASNFVTILVVIGMLALIVNVITEVTKGIPILKRIPMNLQIIVLSLTLSIVTYFAYTSYKGTTVVWYYVVASILAGFIVAYVVLYGWDKLAELYKKFRNIPAIDINTNTVQASAESNFSVNTPDSLVKTNDTVEEKVSNNSIIDNTINAPSANDISSAENSISTANSTSTKPFTPTEMSNTEQ